MAAQDQPHENLIFPEDPVERLFNGTLAVAGRDHAKSRPNKQRNERLAFTLIRALAQCELPSMWCPVDFDLDQLSA